MQLDCLLLPLSSKIDACCTKGIGITCTADRHRGLRLLSHVLSHVACADCVALRDGGLLARLGSHEITTMIPSEQQGQMLPWPVSGCASS